MTAWGTPAEREKRLRILVAVAAYAYEVMDEAILSDGDFDEACRQVNLEQPTGNATMDHWFQIHFEPYTGQWVHQHPDQRGLRRIAEAILQDNR